MRKLLILFLAVLMTTSLSEGEAGAAAPARPEAKAPYAVQISPNMGLLQVREQVKLTSLGQGLYSFVIYVPAATPVHAGFDVFVKGFSLNSVSSRLLLPEDDPAGSPRGELVKKLKAAKREKSRLDGLQQSLTTRLNLWSSQPNKNYESLPAAKDIEAIDASLAVKMPEIYAEVSELPEKQREAEELINYLQNELNALGGEKPQLAEISVTISGAAPQTQAVVAEYSYFSYSCGWWPSYSFDSDPIKGTVIFKQQANIRQNSGRDWNNVEVSLATKAPDFKLQPNNLGVWNLYREQPESRNRAMKAAEMVVMDAEESYVMRQQAAAPAQAPRPVSMEMGTHREWKLGAVNLSSKNPANIELDRQNWKGDFYYTLRPSVEKSAFLTAKVKLEKSVELPAGQAIFMVDGRLAGVANSYRAGGKELELFFGKDEMITVEVQDLISMKGQERFILKSNTYNWHWQFKVENKRSRAVKIKVEDPIPQVRDSSIKLKVESSPKAQEDFRSYYWEGEVKPSGEFVIDHKVEAKASGSEQIIPGR